MGDVNQLYYLRQRLPSVDGPILSTVAGEFLEIGTRKAPAA
jgi:hypothetical protein